MGRQQREKRKKSKASKKKAKAKDEEIPSTPSGEAASLEPPPPANPAQDSSADVEENVTFVITAPSTGIQEGERSPVRMSRRKTRTCKGDLSTNESIPSGDPAQASCVEMEVRATSPVGSARIEEDDASSSRVTRSVTQSSKGEMPSDEPMLCDDPVSIPGVEGEDGANSSVQTAPAARTQDDSGSPVRMTRRVTRSCKVTARINENNNELDGKASEVSSKVQEALVESLQQQLEATVQALQEVSPLKKPLKTPGNSVSPAAVPGTVCVESLVHSPSSFDLNKLSPHSNTSSPVVCLERCSKSDLLACQRTQSSNEALGLSRDEEDLLAAQKPMPLCRKLACVEELPSSEVVKITVKRKSRKISEHLGKRNGCRRRISPSSIAFKIQSLDEGSCTESASSGSVADIVTGESTESGPAPSQLGTPALPSARSKRRGVKRSFPVSDNDQVPCRKLLKLDSCDLVNEESMESQSVNYCGHTNDILSQTDLHEQENCCRCAGANEFSGSSGQCNCRVQSSFSNQSENLETQNETPLHSEYQPGDARASVSESAQSLDQCGSDINLSSFEHKGDVHLDVPSDLSLKDSLVPDVMKSVPNDCSSVNTSTRSGNGQEGMRLDVQGDLSLKCSLVPDVMKSVPDDCSSVNTSTTTGNGQEGMRLDVQGDLSLKCSLVPDVMKSVPDDCSSVNTSTRSGIGQEGDTRDALRDSSLKCSSVCGDMEDIHSTVSISRENDYSHQDDPKDSLLTCSLVPGNMEGVADDCSHVNTFRGNDFSQGECCQNDQEDPGCFGSNHSRSSVNVPLPPLVQHKEGSRLLGGGTPTKSSRKKSKSSRRRQDNSENSDNDGSRSRMSSRNLVDQCGTDGHQEHQDSEDLQDFNGGNTGKDRERSRSASPQNCGQCSRTLPLGNEFINWKSHRFVTDVKKDLGEQTDEHFSKYNDSCREKQDTLTDVPSSEFSSVIGSESLSSQGSNAHSSPSKHKRSYFEGCVNGKFPSERGLNCSASPKSAITHHRFEDGRGDHEGVSEDHARTEKILSKTDDSGLKLNLNRHTRIEIHSALRHEGNSDGISMENHCISDGTSSSSISLDLSVDVKLQSSKYEEKQIVMNPENHRNEKVSQKINRNVSNPLNSDLGSKNNVPPIEHEDFYKNKMSVKGDQKKSKSNSKPNSASHIRSHEPSLKLSNGFDLALDESSKNSHGGKMHSRERKNKKPLLGDNDKTDTEPVKNEKSTPSHRHSKSSSERKRDDARNNKRTRDDLKDRIISKKKKLSSVRSAEHSLISKDGERIEAYAGKSSIPNQFDRGVCESYKVSDHVERSKMIDSSHSGSTKMEYDMRTPGSEKRCSNVTKVIGSSEVGGKDERNQCKRTGKNDAGINTTKQSVSHNVEDTVMNKCDEQPPSTEDDKQERADTITAGESSGQSTEDNLKLLLCSLGLKFGKEKLLSIVSSLGDCFSTQGATEGNEALPCPEEKKQFNESAQKCSPKESGQMHVRNLNNAFEETGIGPSLDVVPGTKDSDQEGESSEIITDNKQHPTDGEVEDTGSSEQQNLGSPESYSSVRNFVHNQEAESQSDSLSNCIKPLKAVGNCNKEMDDNRKLNSSAASLLKIRSQPISSELVFHNSVDSSSKQSRAKEKTSSCNADLASSPPACVVEAESSPSKQLSPSSPKLQGSPKMRTRSQKTSTPKLANDGYENVLTALHLVKSPRSKDDGDRSVSGLQAIETPARSCSSGENSGLNGNKVHLPESKELKKVTEASKVVEKPTTPVRKRLKRNWIVKTTETPPVSQVTSATPSTPPASTTPVPSSCSSSESSPSFRDVQSTPSPSVTTSVKENTSQNETIPLAQPYTSRKSSPSSTLNLPSSECIKKVSPVPVRKGEEFPFKIPSPDKPLKNVPASSRTQEVSPSSLVKTQPRVLNIPKINRRSTSSSSTPNSVIRPLHPRITPPQTNEEDCDDDDAISLFAESADLDIEDMLNSFNPCKRPTPAMSSLSGSYAPRHNFVRRQLIEMPPAQPEPEPEPEPALEPEDMQTEMQEMEFEENNQEEEEEVQEEDEEEEVEEEREEMEVDTNMVDDCDALAGIEDDRESVLAELQSRHSARSFMDFLICNNSEEVKLCVDAVTSRPFSAAGQDSRVSPVRAAQPTRVSPVAAAQATRVSPVAAAQAMRVSPVGAAQAAMSSPVGVPAVMPAQATRISPEVNRPPLVKHLQTNRPSPIKTVQAARPSAAQTSDALSDQSNTLDIGPELLDYRVPKFLKDHEKQRFSKMINRHCFGFLKNGACFKKSCGFKHEVPLLERGDDVLKVVKWSTDRGFLYMCSLYTQFFIQFVCETTHLQGVPLWNGILGCLTLAGKSVKDAINGVITYVFEKGRVEYFAPVLEMLVERKQLLSYRDLLLKVDEIQGFEIPVSVVRYLLTEPKTKQDLLDITFKLIRCESLHRGLWHVERPLIKRYMSGLRSAGFTHLIRKFEQVSRMPVLDYNNSRTVVNGRVGLLPTPKQFRPCTEELFKVPSMSVKESLTQAKCNQRSNLLSRKQQLMESSNVRTPVCETSRPRNSRKFGGVITSEFDASVRNLVAEPEAVKHELPINGLVTRLVSPRTLLEDQSCDFSSYPRNVSQMTKGQEVHDHSAGISSSNKVMLLDRASRVPPLGTPMEQETQLCSSPYSPAFSGSSSSQPHFSLSSLSQEGQGSLFSRKSAASESNSSKSTTGQLSPARFSRDRRWVEDFEPSRADLQERLSVKSRLGATNSSPVLEESEWNPGSVWEVSPMVGERDVRTRLAGRLRDSDIRPEWKLLNMEQDPAPTIGHCSPAAVDDSLIALRKMLLNSDMMSALNILRKFCAHDLRLTFAREAFQALKSNVQNVSMQFGRLMLQSDREQKSLPLLNLLCTVGVNLMFDQMDNGLVNEAQVIYSLLKDRDIHPGAAKIFQEQMSPCRIMLKCCQICLNAKNYHEAKTIVLKNNLQYARPEKWKVKGIPEDSKFRVEVVRNLLAALAIDGPSVEASYFLIAIMNAQSKKFAPVDIRKYSNTVMLSLLKDGQRTEAIELYLEIESERNCLEAPTYRWLLITLEQENMTVLAHRLYGVACLLSVYPLINWNSRPLHVKIFSFWLHEEIMVVIRDFLHQLKQGDQLKPTDDPDHLNLCIYIETQMKPQQSQMKSYPLILSQVKDSIDDAKQRLFGVLRRLGLQATSIPKDRTVQIKPESLAERLKSAI